MAQMKSDNADRDLHSGLIRLHILHHAVHEPDLRSRHDRGVSTARLSNQSGEPLPTSAWIGEEGVSPIDQSAERQITPEDLSSHPVRQDGAHGGQEQDTRVVSRSSGGHVRKILTFGGTVPRCYLYISFRAGADAPAYL